MPVGRVGNAVWHVDLSTVDPASPLPSDWLSADERARAARFLRSEDRHRFIASHLALRHVLAGYLGRAPGALRFRIQPGGKPELDDSDEGRLAFNLSHSGDHALIGVTPTTAIGVDVEVVRPLGDPMAIARAHFHQSEVAALARLTGRRQVSAFLACWTCKEAVVKALGLGLSLPLDGFAVSLPPAAPAILRWDRTLPAPSDWSLHHLDLGADAVGAVAIAEAAQPCTLFRLPPDWAAPARSASRT